MAAASSAGFSAPLLIAAAAATVVWWFALSAVAVARRPPRISARATGALDLPPEPPAVAGVLANDFEVTTETAPAIVIDLAARGFLELEEVQPGKTICRVREQSIDELTGYECSVLVELVNKAIDRVVPADALTTGPEAQSKQWHRVLAQGVVADAQARGLTVPRWPTRLTGVLGTGLGAVVVLLVASSVVGAGATDGDSTLLAAIAAVVAIAGVVLGGIVIARLVRSLAQLPTPAGRDAARRVAELATTLRDNPAMAELPPAAVKLWDRVFAYAAVLGAAPLAVALLPMGSEDDHRAWSRVGGRWRIVRVRYPRVVPPAWGKHPLLAVALALFWGAVAGLVGYGLGELRAVGRPRQFSASEWEWVDLTTAIAFVPVALVVAWCAWVLWRAVPDLWRHEVVVGEILRDRKYARRVSNRDEQEYWYYVAVDDGSRDRIAAWRLRESLWEQVRQGETVRADVTPALGYVRSIVEE